MMVSVMKNGIYKIRTLIFDYIHLDRNLYIIKYLYDKNTDGKLSNLKAFKWEIRYAQKFEFLI